MKKNFFVSGPIGCGKTTALLSALGDHRADAGGFLTVRQRDANGKAARFLLTAPDGREAGVFLDVSGNEPVWQAEVFRISGCELLDESMHKPFAILDEIGGPELLVPEFQQALQRLLESDIPCIGVIKSEYGAEKLMQKLGYAAQYNRVLHDLHQQLGRDPRTCLLHCTTSCEAAFLLARKWVQEYCQ